MKQILKKGVLFVFIFSILFTEVSVLENVYAADKSSNKELNAVWISYLEFSSNGYTESAFKKHIDTMFDNVASMGMNAVIVHVRPFSDAFYPSKYFPWSKYVSGEQGKDPGYDPLAYMVSAAHIRGLEFHAWINPYRITSNSTDINTLSKNHPARKFLVNKSKSDDRYVLSFDGKLYYNPSYSAVRNLIVNGVREIVENYDVDGIHFDDYFYPTLGTNYKTIFDAPEYEIYKKKQIEAKESYRDIVSWRKWQVNSLVFRVYETVKKQDKNIQFGISPAGNIDSLLKDDRYYTDLKTWFTKRGYVDYICPQIYFSFEHKTAAFDMMLNKWINYAGDSKVKLYIGIPVYKVGSNEDAQFKSDINVLKSMIETSRDSGKVSGFMYFSYTSLNLKISKKAVDKLLEVIQ